MKKICLILLVLLLGCGILFLDKQSNAQKTNIGQIKMQDNYSDPSSYLTPREISLGVAPQDASNAPGNNVYSNPAYLQILGEGGSSPTGGGGSTPAPDPYASYGGQANYNNQIGLYDQGINNVQAGINRLPGQQQSANSKIDSSYQDALATLLGVRNQGEQAYTGNKQQTTKDYVGTKNTIGANAGSTLSGLLRLLGSRGAGGSSAYNLSAPGAVARNATLQRSDADNTFGANNQSLDTNWNNYLTGYNNQVKSAGKQREEQLSQNNDTFNSNQASLLQQLAQLQSQKASYTGGNAAAAGQPYLDQANNLLNGVGKFNYTPIGYDTTAYKAPDLASYSASKQTPTYNGQTPQNDYFSPYLQALLGKKQQTVAG